MYIPICSTDILGVMYLYIIHKLKKYFYNILNYKKYQLNLDFATAINV